MGQQDGRLMRIVAKAQSSRVFSINGIKYIRITSKDDISIEDDEDGRPRGSEIGELGSDSP